MMPFRAIGDKESAAPLPAGALAEAVNVFFDRMRAPLPVYVSPMSALLASLVVSVTLFVLGSDPVRQEYDLHKDSLNPVKKFRWVLMLAVLLAVVNMVREFVFERVYHWGFGSIKGLYRENTQHLANMYWLQLYAKALKA